MLITSAFTRGTEPLQWSVMSRPHIHLDPEALQAICRRYGVLRLSLFGSVLRDDFTPESDVDVLVEFLPGKTPSLLSLGGMQMELTQMIGREVDLKTPGFLSCYFRDQVLQSAEVRYVAPVSQ